MITQLIKLCLILLLVIPVATAISDYQFANHSTQCDSGIGRIMWSVYGDIQCVPANDSLSIPTSLTYSQNSTVSMKIEPISESVLEAQTSEATSSTNWADPNEIYWNIRFHGEEHAGVKGIIYWIQSSKNYVWAFIILVLELVKLIFYIVEVLVIIYVMFTLIPETFFKLRDALVRSYVRRYAT